MTSTASSNGELRKWKRDRKTVIPILFLQFILGAVVTTGWLYGGYYHCDFIIVPQSNTLSDIWIYYTRCCVLPCALVLCFSITAVMNKRTDTPAGNPLAGREELVQLEKNILSNTVEQIMLFLMVSLVLITYLDISEMKIIPLFATHWVIGRILFNIGYRIGSYYRALGMSMNIFATFFFLGLVCYLVYTRGFMYGISDQNITEAGLNAGNPLKAEL